MKFHATTFDESDFVALDALVKSIVLNSRDGQDRRLPRFVLVTDDEQLLPPDKMAYIRANPDEFMGLTWVEGVGSQTTLWVDPSIGDYEHTVITLLHEVCHAYNLDSMGLPADNHGPKWRRLFGLALAHWELISGLTHLTPYATMYRRDRDVLGIEESNIRRTVNRTHERVMNTVGDILDGQDDHS